MNLNTPSRFKSTALYQAGGKAVIFEETGETQEAHFWQGEKSGKPMSSPSLFEKFAAKNIDQKSGAEYFIWKSCHFIKW